MIDSLPGTSMTPGDGRLCDLIDTYFRRSIQQWLKATDHISNEQLTFQISTRIFAGVKAVQHLHIFVTYQQFLGFCANDSIEEGCLVLLIDTRGGSPVGIGDFEGDLQIDHLRFSCV